MSVKKIDLCWITVTDLEKTKKFLTQTLGLQIKTEAKEHGWLELSGSEGGCLLGVAQKDQECVTPSLSNAVITLSVDNITTMKKHLEQQGIIFASDIIEVPGHVKLALFQDSDGNAFQLVQSLMS